MAIFIFYLINSFRILSKYKIKINQYEIQSLLLKLCLLSNKFWRYSGPYWVAD